MNLSLLSANLDRKSKNVWFKVDILTKKKLIINIIKSHDQIKVPLCFLKLMLLIDFEENCIK